MLALRAMVINGVSTHKVQQVTGELCGTQFSKSTVSALCAQLCDKWKPEPIPLRLSIA